MVDLSGQSVVITGASRGIGAATARAFVAAGARVALLARSRDAIADLAGEIGADTALAIPCDVTRWWEVSAAMDATLSAFGRVDVLVNNAGVIEPIGGIDATDPDAWAKLIEINVTGVYHGIRAAMPLMAAAGGGTILTVSSGAASRPIDGWGAYCASKAAAAMLTRSVDLEGRDRGIRAMGLSPGTVDTDMQGAIRDSGIGAISQMARSEHIPPEDAGKTLAWMATAEADDLIGTEVSLREPEIRRRVGLDP